MTTAIQRGLSSSTPAIDDAAGAPGREQIANYDGALKGALVQDYIHSNVPELANWATGRGEADIYREMTESGSAWNNSQNDESLKGRSLIAQMSKTNMTSMDQELGTDMAWREPVRQKIEAALKEMELHHYTSEGTIERMLGKDRSGELKSKRKLDVDDPDIFGNTKQNDKRPQENPGNSAIRSQHSGE